MLVAKYTFSSTEKADWVHSLLWQQLGGGFERSSVATIFIYDSCSDVARACQICEKNG